MKYLLALIPSLCFAQNTIELNYSFLTHHIFNTNNAGQLYKNKINDKGLIANQVISLGLRENNAKIRFLFGENSVAEPIIGMTYTRIFTDKIIELGFTVGAYYQDKEDFRKASITCNELECRSIGTSSIMPILGIEFNPVFYRSEYVIIKQNNLLTPIITNHGLGVEWTI